MKLSAIVIAKDAEQSIARVLRSLHFADEKICILDDRTTDNTAAAAAGAKILRRGWTGYGPQKNFGAAAAQGEWLLFIDTDEEVPPALAEEIKKSTTYALPPTPSFYWLRIVTVFLGKPLYHLYGHNPRLFRKDAGRWTDARVHEQVERIRDRSLLKLRDADSKILSQPLLHHSHPTIQSYLKKMHRYTTLDAEQMKRTGRHRSGRPVRPTTILPFRLAARQLVKLLFYRRGILDGYAGIVWCVLSAYYEYEMGRKYIALCE